MPVEYPTGGHTQPTTPVAQWILIEVNLVKYWFMDLDVSLSDIQSVYDQLPKQDNSPKFIAPKLF